MIKRTRWKSLIGFINIKLKASSIIEVIIAMLLIIIGVVGFFSFFVILPKSNDYKKYAQFDYQCKVELIKQYGYLHFGQKRNYDEPLLINSEFKNDFIIELKLTNSCEEKEKVHSRNYYIFNKK